MKILHTSDLHLKSLNDCRWQSLLCLLDLAESEDVDVICVAGDLFDRESDADRLRPEVRGLFSGRNFKILIIPGNHDTDCYAGEYFGSDAEVFTSHEKPFEIGDLSFWGVPFKPGGREYVLKSLSFYKDHLPGDRTNVLLYHGELLDSFFSRGDFGEEGEGRYMPARLSDFASLGFSYVLAGHFHTNFSVRRAGEAYFVYSGSPSSVTKRETGRRKANIFHAGGAPNEAELDTFFYDRRVVMLSPFDDVSPLERVRRTAAEADGNSHLIIDVEGCFNGSRFGMNEQDLAEGLRQLQNESCSFESFGFRDMQRIAGDELFGMFEERLKAKDLDPEASRRIWELVVKAMTEAGA